MTTRSDSLSFDQLRSEGWEVLEKGWPDGLCLSPDKRALVGLELKRPGDGITADQIRCGELLAQFGIHWVVARQAESISGLLLPSNLPQQGGRAAAQLLGKVLALEDEWVVSA